MDTPIDDGKTVEGTFTVNENEAKQLDGVGFIKGLAIAIAVSATIQVASHMLATPVNQKYDEWLESRRNKEEDRLEELEELEELD